MLEAMAVVERGADLLQPVDILVETRVPVDAAATRAEDVGDDGRTALQPVAEQLAAGLDARVLANEAGDAQRFVGVDRHLVRVVPRPHGRHGGGAGQRSSGVSLY